MILTVNFHKGLSSFSFFCSNMSFFLIMQWCWIFSTAFLHQLRWSCKSLSFYQCGKLCWLIFLCWTTHGFMTHLVMVSNLLICYWFWFTRVLWRIFVSSSRMLICNYLLFSIISDFDIREIQAIWNNLGKFILQFSEKFDKDC